MSPGSSGERCPGYQHNVEDSVCGTAESRAPRQEKSYSPVYMEPCKQCAAHVAHGMTCMNNWLCHSGVIV